MNDQWAREADIGDIPDYPEDWPATQRVAAYWHAVHFTNMPGTTEGWHTVWKSALREQERSERRKETA